MGSAPLIGNQLADHAQAPSGPQPTGGGTEHLGNRSSPDC